MIAVNKLHREKNISCTPDRNCHTFCLGDKIASHPGVLTQAKKITQNLEINQILGLLCKKKNLIWCTVLDGSFQPSG